jgi:hypothetical protein
MCRGRIGGNILAMNEEITTPEALGGLSRLSLRSALRYPTAHPPLALSSSIANVPVT